MFSGDSTRSSCVIIISNELCVVIDRAWIKTNEKFDWANEWMVLLCVLAVVGNHLFYVVRAEQMMTVMFARLWFPTIEIRPKFYEFLISDDEYVLVSMLEEID